MSSKSMAMAPVRHRGILPQQRLQKSVIRRDPWHSELLRAPLAHPTPKELTCPDDRHLPSSAGSQSPSPRTSKIFLASSSELKQDRDALQSYFLRENKSCAAKGFEVEMLGWETCLDAMSETRQQDEYNKKVKNCDIFLSLFETKAGKFTEEEFDVAYQAFIEKKKPLIYTYSLSQTSLDQ